LEKEINIPIFSSEEKGLSDDKKKVKKGKKAGKYSTLFRKGLTPDCNSEDEENEDNKFLNVPYFVIDENI
jgi:hypothetical protein